MKILLAAFGGLVVTLAVYASGFYTAMFFLSAEPTPVWKPDRDTASVWTLEPVVVNEAGQEFERLPSRRITDGSFSAGDAIADDVELDPGSADPIETAAAAAPIEDQHPVEAAPETAPSMSTAHVQWCADRYRSYREKDNSYTAYSGESRECISPFTNRAAASAGSEETASPDMTGQLSPQHIQSCFNRYRSYRPEDNSYQPYRGGPRRQCR